MNCTEAQVLLAAHRDLKNEQVDTTELDVHLEHCASCRQILAQYSLIGRQVRTLPPLELAPDMYTKLMRSLASEHAQFLQRSPSTTPPVPEFLKPYLREHATATQKTDPLAAFSTADTGPLPVIRPIRKKSHRPRMGQFTVIGLAAAFLMVFMMGGITALLILAQGHLQTGQVADNISNPTNIVSLQYTTGTAFQHVVSAVANNNDVYYTAFGDSTGNDWMVEQLDRKTNVSTPLLPTPSASPLIVLSSDSNWLIWLQFDQPNPVIHGKLILPSQQTQQRTWSLHYLSLAPQQSVTDSSGVSATLLSGIFDQDTVPSWVHTPVQGIWLHNNTLLVATTDQKGVSHLFSYELSASGKSTSTEIATAGADHVFTSPTATTDGNQIFWADEWRTSDNTLHSNIWTQQTYIAPATYGQSLRHTDTIQQVFLAGGMAFHPVIANNTLFLLSTTNLLDSTPAPSATGTPAAVATPTTLVPDATWADASAYPVQLDDAIVGSLIMYPLDGDPNNLPSQIAVDATSLQAGATFVLWQNRDGYNMYNTVTRSFVTTNDVLSGAQFLAVNGSTAIWIQDNFISTDNTGNTTVTIMAFNWPRPAA
ncbi:MAG TPA: hypothetical protein VKR42_07880 [Ktedonobacteraceae bacterium]|nr:hypothetical protein [Ktedonobacteraceae bacterium]